MKIKSKIMESSVIVIKIGSSILIKKDLFNEKKLLEILEDIKFFLRKKKKIILVASGAVDLGKKYLEESGLNIIPANVLDEAAKKIVDAVSKV